MHIKIINFKALVIIMLIILLASFFSILLTIFFPYKIRQDTSKQASAQHRHMILIDVESCKLYLLDNGICMHQYPIAAGSPRTPTPLGLYKIIHKDDWGEGFGGRWMGLNVPWGTYGIHGTIFPELIGSHVSHGCVRMFSDDVKQLYDIVPYGTPVMIIDGLYGMFGQQLSTLEPGFTGADVKLVQQRLKKLGFYKYAPDGIFSLGTLDALNKFQESRKLPIRDIVGKEEYQALGFIEMD